jgi:hypothetical protein
VEALVPALSAPAPAPVAALVPVKTSREMKTQRFPRHGLLMTPGLIVGNNGFPSIGVFLLETHSDYPLSTNHLASFSAFLKQDAGCLCL